MRSPFPGMDPYLQPWWGDVRHQLVTYFSRDLNRGLPTDLFALIEYRFLSDSRAEGYITVVEREREDDRLITVVEVLSPSNKRAGRTRDEYLAKRDDMIRSGVNIVEVDLIRQGDWQDIAAPADREPDDASDYRAIVRRAMGQGELYRFSLRERLSGVPVPLRENDADVVVDLQPLVDQAYEGANYGRLLNYAKPCVPPLRGADARWADRLLKAAGRR